MYFLPFALLKHTKHKKLIENKDYRIHRVLGYNYCKN